MKRVALPEAAAETLFGNRDENLRFLEDNLKVRIKNDGQTLVVEGSEEGQEVVAQVFDQLGAMIKDGYAASPGDVRVAAQLLSQDPAARLRDYLMKAAVRGAKKVVVPRSLNQRAYLEEIEKNDMVFGIGPAGTGKTYLAVAQAVSSLLAKSVARIVLARPAVEAGEKLGFLPGDLQDKVDPYLRPAVRRALRPARLRARVAPPRAQRDRGGAHRLHARPHPQRRLRDHRRGPEHHHRADEDGAHPHRLRLQGRHHRRHHADRPAHRAAPPAWWRPSPSCPG